MNCEISTKFDIYLWPFATLNLQVNNRDINCELTSLSTCQLKTKLCLFVCCLLCPWSYEFCSCDDQILIPNFRNQIFLYATYLPQYSYVRPRNIMDVNPSVIGIIM